MDWFVCRYMLDNPEPAPQSSAEEDAPKGIDLALQEVYLYKPSEDEKKDCKSWAKKGYCKSGLYVDYMNLRCKKSCKKC